ncbi:hypothetical protein V2J09_023525 [Rumex salicifolius]
MNLVLQNLDGHQWKLVSCSQSSIAALNTLSLHFSKGTIARFTAKTLDSHCPIRASSECPCICSSNHSEIGNCTRVIKGYWIGPDPEDGCGFCGRGGEGLFGATFTPITPGKPSRLVPGKLPISPKLVPVKPLSCNNISITRFRNKIPSPIFNQGIVLFFHRSKPLRVLKGCFVGGGEGGYRGGEVFCRRRVGWRRSDYGSPWYAGDWWEVGGMNQAGGML